MDPVSPLAPSAKVVEEVDSSSLIALAQAGDSDAFCALCRLYEARVLRQAAALCGDTAAAEELAQDTFVTAWKSLRNFHGRCAFFTWLCSILIHLHRDRLRQRRRFTRWLAPLDSVDHKEMVHNLADGVESPAEALVASEHAAFLRQCLNHLPVKHREVVFLRFYAQETLEGIAAALGCSVGTVKSRLFHGLEKLRRMKQLAGKTRPTGD